MFSTKAGHKIKDETFLQILCSLCSPLHYRSRSLQFARFLEAMTEATLQCPRVPRELGGDEVLLAPEERGNNGWSFCREALAERGHRITESQNHRMVGVGRDLCGSSSPTLLLKQGHLQ